jgi:hypothetical protein
MEKCQVQLTTRAARGRCWKFEAIHSFASRKPRGEMQTPSPDIRTLCFLRPHYPPTLFSILCCYNRRIFVYVYLVRVTASVNKTFRTNTPRINVGSVTGSTQQASKVAQRQGSDCQMSSVEAQSTGPEIDTSGA